MLLKQLTGIVLITYLMMAMADRAQDEGDIRVVSKQINAAHTTQDAHSIATFLAEDFGTWDGFMRRKDVSEAWANERKYYRRREDLGVRFMTDEIAIFKERGEAWDVADSDQQAPDTRQYMESWVSARRNGTWLPTAFSYHRLEE